MQLSRLQTTLIAALIFLSGGVLGVGMTHPDGFSALTQLWNPAQLQTAFVEMQRQEPERPLQQFSIPALTGYEGQASQIRIIELIEERDETIAYAFTYQSRGDTMSGQITLPRPEALDNGDTASTATTDLTAPDQTIVMLRGYVPLEMYETGMGTRNAAHYFARNGYVTIAPDFLGYGASDNPPEDSWEGRFIKPIQVVDLIASLQSTEGFSLAEDSETTTTNDEASPSELPRLLQTYSTTPNHIGIWGHSNGGQIALATLEITQAAYPTTLWAPVTAPFPYSILYFGDEQEDEGKQQRAWIGLFEETYDVHDFSLTQHLDQLRAPLQIQQGGRDEAIPYVWNDEFSQKIEAENKRRATDSATLGAEIPYSYQLYPAADHNLQPNWSDAVQNDLAFFQEHLE